MLRHSHEYKYRYFCSKTVICESKFRSHPVSLSYNYAFVHALQKRTCIHHAHVKIYNCISIQVYNNCNITISIVHTTYMYIDTLYTTRSINYYVI